MSDAKVHAEMGIAHLRAALDCFKAARSKRTAERVALAISSAKGAIRHADNKRTHVPTRVVETGKEV